LKGKIKIERITLKNEIVGSSSKFQPNKNKTWRLPMVERCIM